MKALINVVQNPDNSKTVSGRDLHEYLIVEARGGQTGEMFAHWMDRMIDYLGLEENLDYTVLELDYRGIEIFSKSDNQRVAKREFALSLDAAKQISMIQKNDRGRKARQYFIGIEKKKDTGELLTHEQVLYLVELKEVFKYISHCQDAERMNHSSFVSRYEGRENPHAAFHRMRNEMLEMKPEDVDARIREYCLEHRQRVPKSKRAKLEMLNPYEVLRNGVWDFLHGRGRADALPLANLVRGMAEREGTSINRRNENDLFRQRQDVGIPQLA